MAGLHTKRLKLLKEIFADTSDSLFYFTSTTDLYVHT